MYQEWAKAPVIIPRWALYLIDGLFIALGIVLAFSGSPSIDLSTPQGYLFPYGLAIAGAATLALVGAMIPRRVIPELLGVILLFALLTVYIASTIGPWAAGDQGRGALGIVVTIASLLPFIRIVTLGLILVARWRAKA